MEEEIDQTTLTAYALGELEPAETARVEAFLRESAFARGYVATIRRTGGLLSADFEREAVDELTAEQKSELEHRIDQAAGREPMLRRTQRRWNRVVLAGSIAASTLIVGGLAVLMYSRIYRDFASKQDGGPTPHDPGIIIQITPRAHMLPPGRDSDHSPTATPSVPGDSADDPAHWAASPTTAPSLHFVSGVPDSPVAPDALTHVGAPQTWFEAYQHQKKSEPAIVAGNDKLPPVDPGVFARFADNPFRATAEQPVSTFSADVANTSYMNVRRALAHGQLPPAEAVRVEEMLNHFNWKSPVSSLDGPLSGEIEISACPWNQQHQLARVLLRTREIVPDQRPAVNLVFLVDVSAGMKDDGKLPLICRALRSLVSQLQSRDRIALVVAQSERMLLRPTAGDQHQLILDAIDHLHAGGAAAAGGGLDPAYAAAAADYLPGGINRVVLISDGHWLDGVADPDAIAQKIHRGAASGAELSILATSPTYLDDLAMRHLALAGDGTLSVIDTAADAGKALIKLIDGSLIQVAQDVQITVRLDPMAVASYRLLGYESHAAGEADSEQSLDHPASGAIGAGHSVTALYELVRAGDTQGSPMAVSVRYRRPGRREEDSLEVAAPRAVAPLASASNDFYFASAIAEFSMLLRSFAAGDASFAQAIDLAQHGIGANPDDSRAEFIALLRQAEAVSSSRFPVSP